MDIGKDLTKRQQEIFDFIKKYSAKYGYPPTVRDIGKAARGPFSPDPLLPSGFAKVTSHVYDGSGFDRGVRRDS